MVAYWSCAALLIRGDLSTLLECAKYEYRRMGDASPFSRPLYLLVDGVLIRTPLKKGLSTYCPFALQQFGDP
jgi:hypothetical protein